MSDVSIFPLQEMMLICKGCGGERKIPDDVLATIKSVDDLKKFTDGPIALYSCQCGAKRCDIRMLPNAAALEK